MYIFGVKNKERKGNQWAGVMQWQWKWVQ